LQPDAWFSTENVAGGQSGASRCNTGFGSTSGTRRQIARRDCRLDKTALEPDLLALEGDHAMPEPTRSTIDAGEVERFSALAAEWWNPNGKFRPLHKFNPVRLAYIRDQIATRFGRDSHAARPFEGLRILDIGCGGGILCEPLARLGADMVGADPAAANIEAARLHATQSGLAIDYRLTTAEALADAGERFDVVLAMEVVEHVADVALFVKRCAEMVKPGGLMIAATLNRTLKSFALAIVGAEYVLGWLPRGTHQWDKFVTPNELEIALERGGLRVTGETGVIYNLLADRWQISTDTDVNYMVTAEKPA
jgi:2-polyprenyl-6-hydroxyphenyl methylase / 3-demethylubiquinone-9 3-methyltransferase